MQTIKTIPIIIILFIFSVFSFLVFAQDEPSAIPSFEVCDGSNCNPQVSNTRMVDEDGTSQTLFKRGTFIRIHTDIVDPGGIKYARAIVKNVDGDVVTTIPLYNDGSKNHGDASSYLNGSINGANDDTYSALWLAAYIFRTGVTYRLLIEACDNFEHIYYSDPYELEFSLIDAYSSNCSNIGELKCVGNLIQRCSHDDEYNINIWQNHISCAPSVCCGSHPNVICCSSGQSCIAGVCVCQDIDGDGHADSFCGGDDCDDNNEKRFPGNPEICDGIDNDCNPSVTDETVCDSDHDDYCNCSGTFVFGSNLSAVCPRTNTTNQAAINNTCDCNDSNFNINPDAIENCVNNIDDNCNADFDCDDDDCATNPICHPNVCPNTVCDPGECSFCLEDCDINDCCGNGTCDSIIGENSSNCLIDCPDTISPTVDSFTAVYNSALVDITWTVSDTGNSHLDRIEVWRAPDSGGSPGPWSEVSSLRQTITFQNTDNNSNMVTDNPGNGTWWYGLHVVDQAGNIGAELNPIQVIVFSCADDCAIGDTDCSGDNITILDCGENDEDICLDWVQGQDCSASGQVCRINNLNTANCCSNLCVLGTDSPRCNSINTAIETCQQQATGCGDWGITQNCSGAESCHLDSSGNPNCCADQCALSDAPRCNSGDTAVETCQAQSNGCNNWAISENCGAGKMCHEGACVDQCADDCAIGDTDCSGDNITILDCGENDGDICLDWVTGQDCSASGQVCRINSSNTANCCSNLCILGIDTPRCNTGNTAIETCQTQNSGCGDWGISQNCTGAESCHLDSSGNPNCCADLCALSDAPRCNAGDTAIETCQAQSNGCNNWAISENCIGGQMCYDGPLAYCDTIDNDPPVITLISPVASSQSWTQTAQADFETTGYSNNQTNTTEVSGSVQLDSFLSNHTITQTDNTSNIARVSQTGGWAYGNFSMTEQNGILGDEASVQAIPENIKELKSTSHICALKNNGTVYCWGINDHYQLGTGFAGAETDIPAQVLGVGGAGFLDDIQTIEVGDLYTCALKNNGTVYCWGYNNRGRLGDNTTIDKHYPIQVHGINNVGFLNGVQSISIGDGNSCALKNDGTVYCWGNNIYGRLGDNTTTDRHFPVQVHGVNNVGFLDGVQNISVGSVHACAVKNDGTAYCWGNNSRGRLGDNTTTTRYFPVQVHGVNNVGFLDGVQNVSLSCHSCAVKNDGTVYCWGPNGGGQLGDSTTTDRHFPAQVHGVNNVGFLNGIQEISASCAYVCVLKNNGTVYCWGENINGALGDNTTTNKHFPVQVHGVDNVGFLEGIQHISFDISFHSAVSQLPCGFKDNKAYCWGKSIMGTTVTTPVQISKIGDNGEYHYISYFDKESINSYSGYIFSWDGFFPLSSIDSSFDFSVISSNSNSVTPTFETGTECLASGQTSDSSIINLSGCTNSNDQYLWYKAEFNGLVAPLLKSVTVDINGAFHYYLSGTFTSSIYDTVSNTEFNTINWTEVLPNNTSIQIKVRSSNNSDMSGAPDWNTCSAISNGSDISNNPCVHDGDRYIQYQAILSTTDDIVTPSLDDITINFVQNPVYYIGDTFNFRFQITDASPLSSVNLPKVFIQFPDNNNVSTLTLYDDGAHLDGATGDGVYGTNAWNSAGHSLGAYYVDVFAEDNKGNSVLENNIASYHLICDGTIIYRTTSTHEGNFGGRSGLDSFCQANKPASLSCNNIHAFISVTQSDELRDMPSNYGYDSSKSVYWYKSSNQSYNQFSSNWSNMLDGDIDVSRNDGGDGGGAWSASKPDGSVETYGSRINCGDWSNNHYDSSCADQDIYHSALFKSAYTDSYISEDMYWNSWIYGFVYIPAPSGCARCSNSYYLLCACN